MKKRWLTVSTLMIALLLLRTAHAEPSAIAQTEINHLLASIEQSGCEFYRNGSWHDAKMAQAHLRSKYEYLAAKHEIHSAEDFIEKAATKSSLSGQPYKMKCNGAEPVATEEWLRNELARYRAH